ncbi:hypothetical protein N7E70_022525 [Aminobacter sp. NyZ550]|uniref:hypothetical protein n=1 Tax=Aminobacter sp. NyZ550 TaxID=2979870 RepID=UPI0021D60A7E|nr:hypothetical protein [Aminobacter sp. NyZ550]WAX94418.1 hypothetical protein N7E70_022525 [Aminobacter sp. NyZ550]
MARLRIRFLINKGRHGAPLAKLGRISEQAEKFLRSLAADAGIDVKPGEWLAVNFNNGSVEYDAEFQGSMQNGAAQVFVRGAELLADYDPENEGLNSAVSEATALEYSKIGALIDPDETIGMGIYPALGGSPKWRLITYGKTVAIRKQMEAPIPSHGTVQGIIHTLHKEAKEPFFQLRELATEGLVKVFYPNALYSEVADALRERNTMIMASGNMLYDRVSRAASEMRMERIAKMPTLSSAEFERFFGSAADFKYVDFDSEHQ